MKSKPNIKVTTNHFIPFVPPGPYLEQHNKYKHYSFSESTYTYSCLKRICFHVGIMLLVYTGITTCLMLLNKYVINSILPFGFTILAGLCLVFPLLCNDICQALYNLIGSRYDYIEIVDGDFKYKTLFDVCPDRVVFATYKITKVFNVKRTMHGIVVSGVISADYYDGYDNLIDSLFLGELVIPDNFIELDEIADYLKAMIDNSQNNIELTNMLPDWQQFLDERKLLDEIASTCDCLIQYTGIKSLIQKVSKAFPLLLLLIDVIIESII